MSRTWPIRPALRRRLNLLWRRQGALQRNNDRPAARMDTEPYDAVSQTLLDAAHLAVVWSKLHVVLALLR